MSLAWDAFQESNGARSAQELRDRIGGYRRAEIARHDDPKIGCVLLEEPFFFPENEWIPCPPDFHRNTQQGKSYTLESESGRHLWHNFILADSRCNNQKRDRLPAHKCLAAWTERNRQYSDQIGTAMEERGSYRSWLPRIAWR